MRKKSESVMNEIIVCANRFNRENGRSPSTTELAREIGMARGTIYKYLVDMNDRKMIQYNGKEIVTRVVEQINHCVTNTPILGRVACGDATSEEENIEEYVDLPTSIFGSGDLFILEAYGDSMNRAGIEEGDMVVVKRTTDRPSDGDLVIALTNGENNLKRIHYDDKKRLVYLCPESDNPEHHVKAYPNVVIQGVVSHIIKKAKKRRVEVSSYDCIDTCSCTCREG